MLYVGTKELYHKKHGLYVTLFLGTPCLTSLLSDLVQVISHLLWLLEMNYCLWVLTP